MFSVVLQPYGRADMSQFQYNTHSLVEIPPSEWKTLLELYAQKKKQSTGYHLIDTYIRWIGQDPQLDAKCYSLDGDWQNDGTFILIAKHSAQLNDVFFNTLSDNLDRLTNALLCLPANPNLYMFYSYGEHLLPAVDEFRRNSGNVQFTTQYTAWYSASKELVDTFTIEIPSGIELRSLEIKDAPTLNEIWPHRSDGSVEFVERLILKNISVGAYDVDGKLIAWCLRLPIGALGLLQVLDTHKRLGLGNLVVRYMSKKISEMGDEVLAPVITKNTASRNMFEKLGFQNIDNVYWTG